MLRDSKSKSQESRVPRSFCCLCTKIAVDMYFFTEIYTTAKDRQKRLRLSLQLSLSSFSPSSPVDFRCSTWSKRTRASPRFYEVGNFQFLFTSVCFYCAAFALSFIFISVNFLFHLRFCHVESFGREFELVSRRPLCVIGARWALIDDSRWCKKKRKKKSLSSSQRSEVNF